MKKLGEKQSKEIRAGKNLAPANSWIVYQIFHGS